MKFFLFVIVTVAYLSITEASMIRVPQDQPTIQAGINAAIDGDTVLVSRNEYFENINFNGKNITVASNFLITNDPADIELTIINGSQPVSPDSASCVRIVSHETAQAQLIGFTLTGGKGTKWIDEHGAGIYREGGGILITLSSPTIKYNRIINNEAYDKTGVASAGGGGIRVGDSNPLIEGNYIAFNKGRYGAGLVLNYTGGTVSNNIFYKNSGGEDFGGGAIWAYNTFSAPITIINNTIYQNASSTKGGGGIYVWSTAVSLINNIIYGNTGGLTPNIKVGTGASVSAQYNDIEGGYTGTGNINSDPLITENFTLGTESPCIDEGNPSAEYNDIEDPQSTGNALIPSLGTLRNDMGAYGGPNIVPFSQILNPVKEQSVNNPADFYLYSNYPNPFNPETTITYTLPGEGFVTLTIMNILGETESVRVSEYQHAGSHSIRFDGSSLATGIYFYELNYAGLRIVRKMMLLK